MKKFVRFYYKIINNYGWILNFMVIIGFNLLNI